MKRTTTSNALPDVINSSCEENFTNIPNEMLRDPAISFRAKGILCLLLSNREGWKSYMATILDMTSEGKDAIRIALNELETNGYLKRIRCRNIDTKQIIGTTWAYTNIPNSFNDTTIEKTLNAYHVEVIRGNNRQIALNSPQHGKPQCGKPHCGEPQCGNPPLIILKKNTNKKRVKKEASADLVKLNNLGVIDEPNIDAVDINPNLGKIVPSQFDMFWSIYPRHVDKGAAKTKWEQICSRTGERRPTWLMVQSAIEDQKGSERWRDPMFIPYPATWLNQQRWLDDSRDMVPPTHRGNGKDNIPDESPITIIRNHFKEPDIARIFNRCCYHPALLLMNINYEGIQSHLAAILVTLHKAITDQQRKNMNKDQLELMPGPTQIIQDYITWIKENDWIDDLRPSLFDMEGKVFGKFRRYEASLDNMGRDPITGDIANRDR